MSEGARVTISKRLIAAGLLAALVACTSSKTSSTTESTAAPQATETVAPAGSIGALNKGTPQPVVSGRVDLKKVGAPVYPGAVASPDAWTAGSGGRRILTLKAAVPFSVVHDWYAQALPDRSEYLSFPGKHSVSQFRVGADMKGQRIIISLSGDDTSTEIQIIKNA